MIKFNDKVLTVFQVFCELYDTKREHTIKGLQYCNDNNLLYRWNSFYSGISDDINPGSFVPHIVSGSLASPLLRVNTMLSNINENMKERMYFKYSFVYFYDLDFNCQKYDIDDLSTDVLFNMQFQMNQEQYLSFQLGYLIHKKYNKNFFLLSRVVKKCIKELS